MQHPAEHKLGIPSLLCMAHVPKHSFPNGFVSLSAAFSSADVALLSCPGAKGAQSELCSISSSPASTEGMYGYTQLPDDAQTESHLLVSNSASIHDYKNHMKAGGKTQRLRCGDERRGFQMRQKSNTRLLVC